MQGDIGRQVAGHRVVEIGKLQELVDRETARCHLQIDSISGLIVPVRKLRAAVKIQISLARIEQGATLNRDP